MVFTPFSPLEFFIYQSPYVLWMQGFKKSQWEQFLKGKLLYTVLFLSTMERANFAAILARNKSCGKFCCIAKT